MIDTSQFGVLSSEMKKSAVLVLWCMIALVFAGRQDQGPRIIGGRDAEISEFPSMVSIRRKTLHQCVGTLLNEEWVLTVRI